AYAKSVGRKRNTVQDEVSAARVAQTVPDIRHELVPYYSQLVVIHRARSWLWPALAAALLQQRWRVEEIEGVIRRLKNLPPNPPKWMSAGFLIGLVAGTVPPDYVGKIEDLLTRTADELQEIEGRHASVSGNDPASERFRETTFEQRMATYGV